MLIISVFAVKLQYEQKTDTTGQITELDASNAELRDQIKGFHEMFSTEIHQLHDTLNQLEGTLGVL